MSYTRYALSSGFGPYGDLACYDDHCNDEFGFIDPDIQCDYWDKVNELVDLAESNAKNNKIKLTKEDLEKGSTCTGINIRGSRWFSYSDGSYSYLNRNGSIFITNK